MKKEFNLSERRKMIRTQKTPMSNELILDWVEIQDKEFIRRLKEFIEYKVIFKDCEEYVKLMNEIEKLAGEKLIGGKE